MEQRCNIRNSVQHNVVIDCPGLGLSSANISDFSLGGMFVETAGLLFPLEAQVFVAFDSAPGVQHDGLGLEAMVVRHTSSGVGLMFLDVETKIIHALKLAQSGVAAVASTMRAGH